MQVISSLLNLSSFEFGDSKVKTVFQECQKRVEVMALVHEKLCQSDCLCDVAFRKYICSLAENIFFSYGIDQSRIRLKVDGDNVNLSYTEAVPCGLIVNEILSNALKHAFPDGRSGDIEISIELIESNKVRLTISDNGVGLPPDMDPYTSNSFGLKIIITLAKQLKGKIEITGTTGTRYCLEYEKNSSV